MGVPAFYRWLVDKYPKVVANAIQDPILDVSSPNPNGLEFDNFYFDMNGIIHPCFHPEDLNDFQPTSFKQVFNAIFDYVDQLFSIVRPRKLIFFAIDGVAPRAKMNQQRARRFQSAKNSEKSEQEEDRLRSEYERDGKMLHPKAKSQLDDSNIITPGTEFMHELSKALQGYIHKRLQENPAWKNLKVILSDSNVPGEGEHKIMSFIRSQRSLPDYDVNTRHCLHGLDADLIMLALATHELHFSILREDVLTVKEEQPLHSPSSIPDRDAASPEPFPVKKSCSYQFLHVWILREYLELDMQPFDAPEGFKFDVERAVDDFVFMCFFVGNDFLPHLPSLDIHERALDLLMTVYKTDFKSLGGYLVNAQRVNEPNGAYLELKRVEKMVLSLGSYEDQIFQKRTGIRDRRIRRILNELSSRNEEANDDFGDMDIPIVSVPTASLNAGIPNTESDDILENTKKLKEDVRKHMCDEADAFKTGQFPADKIKYGTAGWKERYYKEKFATKDHLKLQSLKKEVVKEYTQGLCWVLHYYYSGVPSWTWFYPFHYGPCASDLKGLGQLRVKFQEGLPFEPFDQLMAVLPPRSAEALPMAYRKIMLDESSDLAPFYPRGFEVDMDGKRFHWQGKCILPFIDETRLLSSTRKAKEELKDYEEQRNLIKTNLVFTRASSDFGSQILSCKIDENQSNANGVGGFVSLNLHALDYSEGEDRIICVTFTLPKPRIHVPRIPENVNFPVRTIHESDIEETILWHEQRGGSSTFRAQRVPNQTRHLGLPESDASGVVAGSGWAGRGRGFSGFPSQNPGLDRSGAYCRPNYTGNPRSSSPSRPYIRGRSNWRPVDHRAAAFRPTPAPPGFRPRAGNLSYYHHPHPSWSNSHDPRSHNNAWSPSPQMVGQFEGLRVSAPEGRGFGRGRGANATGYGQGSGRGGRGRAQFWPSHDSGSSQHW